MLTIGLALVSVLLALIVIAMIWRRNPFHAAIFFLLLATVDVFFPAVYWTLFGQVNNPDWLPFLSQNEVLAGLVFYSAFLFVFIAFLLATDGARAPRVGGAVLSAGVRVRLEQVIWILLTLTLAKMAWEMARYGGLEAWLWSKVVFGTVLDAEGATLPEGGVFAVLPARELFQAVVGLAFFCRNQLPRRRLFAVYFPLIAAGLAAATFLRGALLGYAVTMIFAEAMRRKAEGPASAGNDQRATGRHNAAAAGVLAVVLSMYVYGALRDSVRGLASGGEDATVEFALPTFLTAGHGLLGVSHIVAEYGHSVGWLWGKTYIDSLLLPVPRSIYPSKPEWYGIDDITRSMGWPESTQSAVTMPGEAFASFGLAGLLVAVPLGIGFGWLQRLVRSNPIRYLLVGPTVFFQIATVANWMSFTGIMNAAPTLALLLALAAYIEKGRARYRAGGSDRPAPGGVEGQRVGIAGTARSIPR